MYAVFAAINSQRMTLKVHNCTCMFIFSRTTGLWLCTSRTRGETHSLALQRINDRVRDTCRAVRSNSLSHLPPGEAKRNCGSPIKGLQSTNVASSAPSLGGYIHSMGRPRRRPARVKRNGYHTKICNLDSRNCSAVFCDAFSRKWDYHLGWAFLPPSLIPSVLAHLNSAKGSYIRITLE